MTQATFQEKLEAVLSKHENLYKNKPRRDLIADSVKNKEAFVAKSGALATWTPPESTGRSPKDTLCVQCEASEDTIDWDSPNNLPVAPETFEMVKEDALKLLEQKEYLYLSQRVVGADSKYALPVHLVTDHALTALFADNMFRPTPSDIERSTFAKRPFTLVSLPYDKLDKKRYEGRLRTLEDGTTSNMIVGMDFDNYLGIIVGSAYLGSVKKLIFTVMNYLLPAEGVLPLHCSANEGKENDPALLLGLSGTGKTTLSADASRALLGDDEHGWSEDGIWNFENGCYAKLIDLDPKKEPEIFNAVNQNAPYLEHGTIVENTMMYPNGKFDFFDDRFTPNSRTSYPLTKLSNIKESSAADHPKTILFLTADANGVLPPVAKLTEEQAMLWFLMGYTSKLAGTETGVTEPVTVFSRFFGQPFMPRNPDVYAKMLGEKLRKYGTKVYLINTGWSGGPYGVGARMDIMLTRALVNAALSGALEDVPTVVDPIFKVQIPTVCPGCEDTSLLNPRDTWPDKAAYDDRAKRLAAEFAAHFEKAYGDKGIDDAVVAQCPGR